jgi:4,5-dihydroxyphthalate decarboxylase
MSHKISLTAAMGDYDLHRSLILGEVQPASIDLTVLTLHSTIRHWRMLRNMEFDISELSMSSYLIHRSQPNPSLIAIPVFPHRRFRHSYIFVNPKKGISHPKDLEGGRVGLRTWQNSMAVWMKGILKEEYGVDTRSITWVTKDPEHLQIQPEGYTIEQEGGDIEQMLLNGELDAIIYPDLPKSLLAGNPNITRLFQNYKEEEMRFFQKTNIFPIMHTVVIKESVLDKYPWVALSLLHAFRQSKDDAWHRMKDPRTISLAWARELIEEQRAVLGADPWPTGLDPNRKILETLMRYSTDQGMWPGGIPLEELFYPSTLVEGPEYKLE